MAVTDVKAMSAEASETEEGHREVTVMYFVRTDSRNDGPLTALAASGLPLRGSFYSFGGESSNLLSCRTRGPAKLASQKDTLKLWHVPVLYSSQPTGSGSGNPDDIGKDDPVDWQWKLSGSFAQYLKAVIKDSNGNAVVNSAQEPFLPLPEQDDPRDVLVLEKNTRTINLRTRSKYMGSVNSLPIWGLDARMCKLMQWEWTINWVGFNAYVSNRFEVHIRYDGWYYQPLDQGFREKIGVKPDGTWDYREITARGERVRTPQLLDGFGTKLLANANPVFFDGVGAHPQPYEIEPERDFYVLFPGLLPGPFDNTII